MKICLWTTCSEKVLFVSVTWMLTCKQNYTWSKTHITSTLFDYINKLIYYVYQELSLKKSKSSERQTLFYLNISCLTFFRNLSIWKLNTRPKISKRERNTKNSTLQSLYSQVSSISSESKVVLLWNKSLLGYWRSVNFFIPCVLTVLLSVERYLVFLTSNIHGREPYYNAVSLSVSSKHTK